MSIRIQSFPKDLKNALKVLEARKEAIQKASPVPDPKDPIRELADKLHPASMEFVVESVRLASPTSRTYRLKSAVGHIPVFQAGQYVNFRLRVGESELTRPYTISSAPCEALGDGGYIEVTVRRHEDAFVPAWFFENVQPGTHLTGNMPFGTFYWEPMRDSKNIVALAGGSGITPFASMAREIAFGKMKDARITILFGSVKSGDIVLKKELDEAEAASDRVKVVHVLSDDPDWQGEHGFLTRELIEKYAGKDPTYMFCGPLTMYRLIEKNMNEMGITRRRFRRDVLNQPADARQIEGWSQGNEEKTYKITVVRGISETVISASGGESIAVALERAAIPVDTHCRSGECGYCRTQLLAGEVFIPETGDGRRHMDKELGWIHACCSYPVSDLRIRIPIL
jgi:ferredoxin-NADP reductase